LKRPIDIERLLVWAYREELAKLDFLASGASSFWCGFAELGTKVFSGGGNSLQSYAAIIGDGVHPDAEAVHREVCALGQFQPDWEEPEALLSDMPAEVQALAASAVKGFRVQLDVLVLRCARLGTRPDWHADGVPQKRARRSERTGQPAWFVMEDVPVFAGRVQVGSERREVDGFDRTARRPKPGAYKKYVYEPDPALLVDRRAEYCCWHAGLERLAESLSGGLSEHEALRPAAEALPWEGERKPQRRILPALRAHAA
jgi:hypothetical protein